MGRIKLFSIASFKIERVATSSWSKKTVIFQFCETQLDSSWSRKPIDSALLWFLQHEAWWISGQMDRLVEGWMVGAGDRPRRSKRKSRRGRWRHLKDSARATKKSATAHTSSVQNDRKQAKCSSWPASSLSLSEVAWFTTKTGACLIHSRNLDDAPVTQQAAHMWA